MTQLYPSETASLKSPELLETPESLQDHNAEMKQAQT